MSRSDIPLTRAELEALLARGHETISALCHQRIRWEMSIPARPDVDPDLILGGALREAGRALKQSWAERDQLFEKVERLKLENRDWERDLDDAMKERDSHEEWLNEIFAALGMSEEDSTWSSANDPREVAVDAAMTLVGERDTLAAQVAEMRRVIGSLLDGWYRAAECNFQSQISIRLALMDAYAALSEMAATEAEKRAKAGAEALALLEPLFASATVSKQGQIEIALPLPKTADWDGVTCRWDADIFRAALRAARRTPMRVKGIFAWYDMWVGLYWDRQQRRLYVFPIPMFGLVIDLKEAADGK